MKAAASSCRTRTNRILSWRRRSASIIHAFLSPGSPKTTETSHSTSFSTRSSAVVALAPDDCFRGLLSQRVQLSRGLYGPEILVGCCLQRRSDDYVEKDVRQNS